MLFTILHGLKFLFKGGKIMEVIKKKKMMKTSATEMPASKYHT